MAIIGFTMTKLFGERKKVPKGEIKINHSLNIEDIKEQKVQLEKGKGILDFIFEFKVDYSPDVANMNISGKVHYMDEEKKIKEIAKSWDKDKNVDPKIMTPIINMAFHKSLLKALDMSQTLGVPPVIPMPKVTPKSEGGKENYIG